MNKSFLAGWNLQSFFDFIYFFRGPGQDSKVDEYLRNFTARVLTQRPFSLITWSVSFNFPDRLSYGIIAKTKVVMQADHPRLSRLWHRFKQQTHASDGFFSCVTKAESMCTAMKDMSCINEKKKGGRGAMFDPNASVQSIIHGTVWGTRQEMGMVFEIRWRVFWQN